MLPFLHSFCQVLTARDGGQIRRHLRHPLARALPRAVRIEALAIARAGSSGGPPPTRALRFHYQTLQLLASPDAAPHDDASFTFRHPEQPMPTTVAATV